MTKTLDYNEGFNVGYIEGSIASVSPRPYRPARYHDEIVATDYSSNIARELRRDLYRFIHTAFQELDGDEDPCCAVEVIQDSIVDVINDFENDIGVPAECKLFDIEPRIFGHGAADSFALDHD